MREESEANASNGRPPRHLTRLERLALPESGTDPDSIRQLRQRRWTARHGNNGLTMDELDLVAPVRSYEKGLKGTSVREEASSEEEVVSPETARNGIATWGDASDDTCAVCLDDMADGDKTRKLRCGHDFHADCIQAWVTKANRCPVCSIEPLEAASIAKRRNARSSTRRGIDAAISQQRRRRTRGANGLYELDSEGNVSGAALAEDGPEGANEEVGNDEAAAAVPRTSSRWTRPVARRSTEGSLQSATHPPQEPAAVATGPMP